MALDGFDPLSSGRLEDLDFALQGYLAGYMPGMFPRPWSAQAWPPWPSVRPVGLRPVGPHTLLFQWKNLRHRASGPPSVRPADSSGRRRAACPLTPRERRWAFVRALPALRRMWVENVGRRAWRWGVGSGRAIIALRRGLAPRCCGTCGPSVHSKTTLAFPACAGACILLAVSSPTPR